MLFLFGVFFAGVDFFGVRVLVGVAFLSLVFVISRLIVIACVFVVMCGVSGMMFSAIVFWYMLVK